MRSARKGWWSPSPAPTTMGSSPGKGEAASSAVRHLLKEGNVIHVLSGKRLWGNSNTSSASLQGQAPPQPPLSANQGPFLLIRTWTLSHDILLPPETANYYVNLHRLQNRQPTSFKRNWYIKINSQQTCAAMSQSEGGWTEGRGLRLRLQLVSEPI